MSKSFQAHIAQILDKNMPQEQRLLVLKQAVLRLKEAPPIKDLKEIILWQPVFSLKWVHAHPELMQTLCARFGTLPLEHIAQKYKNNRTYMQLVCEGNPMCYQFASDALLQEEPFFSHLLFGSARHLSPQQLAMMFSWCKHAPTQLALAQTLHQALCDSFGGALPEHWRLFEPKKIEDAATYLKHISALNTNAQDSKISMALLKTFEQFKSAYEHDMLEHSIAPTPPQKRARIL